MAEVLHAVKHYQRVLERSAQDNKRMLRCIEKLYQLPVTVQLLQDTGVGRTVNALRKGEGEVALAARTVIAKWKQMVADEEEELENQQAEYNENCRSPSPAPSYENDRVSEKGYKNTPAKYDKDHSKSTHEYGQSEMSTSKIKNDHEKSMDYRESKIDISQKEIRRDKEKGNDDRYDRKRKHDENTHEYSKIRKLDTPSSSDNDDSEEDDRADDEDGHDENYREKSISENESVSDHDNNIGSKSASDDESEPEVHPPKTSHKSSSKTSTSNSSSNNNKSKHSHHRDRDESERHKSKHKSDIVDSSRKESSSMKSSSKHHESDRSKSKSNKDSNKSNNDSVSEKYSSQSPQIEDLHRKYEKLKQSEKEKKREKEKHSDSKERHSKKSDKTESESNSSNKTKHSESKESHSSHSSKHSEGSKHRSHKDKHSDKERHSSDRSKKSSSKHRDVQDKSVSDKRDSKDSSDTKRKDLKEESKRSKDRHSSSKSVTTPKSDQNKSEVKLKYKESPPEIVPEKKKKVYENCDDGIDGGSGASFAEALGMSSSSKSGISVKKKSITYTKTTPTHVESPSDHSSSKQNHVEKGTPSLLQSSTKLTPLPSTVSVSVSVSALPDISPNYVPRPAPKLLDNPLPPISEEEALKVVMNNKNQRTKVFSGNKSIHGNIPSLHELCIFVLQENINAIEFTGGVPYEILKPVVDKASPDQLFMLEHYNPYLINSTDLLWQTHCNKRFRSSHREEMESWRDMYMRCCDEQEAKLKSLTANIKLAQNKSQPIRQTKMAYVDSVVKPPRNIARKQSIHGTARKPVASPAARVAALANSTVFNATTAVGVGASSSAAQPTRTSSTFVKPKKAPLMQKALQLIKGRYKR